MGEYMVKMKISEVAALTPEKVAYVVLFHDAAEHDVQNIGETPDFYEFRVLRAVAPLVEDLRPDYVKSVWSVDLANGREIFQYFHKLDFTNKELFKCVQQRAQTDLGTTFLAFILKA